MNHHYHKFSHFGLIGRSDPCRSVLPQASRAVLTKDLVVCSHTPSCLVESPLCGLTFQTLKQETESKQRLRIASRISFTQLTMRLGNLHNSRLAMIPDRPNMVFLPHMPKSRFLDAKHILRENLAQMCTIATSSDEIQTWEKESAIVPESRISGHPCNLLRPACISAAADSLPGWNSLGEVISYEAQFRSPIRPHIA